jgi:hypothetical protein
MQTLTQRLTERLTQQTMRALFVTATLFVVSCGCDPGRAPSGDATADAARADGPTTCGGVGALCATTNDCASGLTCYQGGGGGFCGPSTDCGGFIGKACPAGSNTVCILPTLCADCNGACVTPQQLSCICPADRQVAGCPDAG